MVPNSRYSEPRDLREPEHVRLRPLTAKQPLHPGPQCTRKTSISLQGTKLTFSARSHLDPKFSKVVAKAKKLGAIKKKKDSYKNALYSDVKWKGFPSFEFKGLCNQKGNFTSQYTTLHLENPRWRMLTFSVCSIRDDSSTLKLYLVAKNIKLRYTKPKEFWSPTWRLAFESWSPAR